MFFFFLIFAEQTEKRDLFPLGKHLLSRLHFQCVHVSGLFHKLALLFPS